MSLYDIMMSARNAHAAADIGLQFALSEAQVQSSLHYLVPLFGDAVIRLMLSPQGLAALLGQLGSPQHQLDSNAEDLFQNSRILANGTGLLSLLFHNEATIRVVAAYAAEGAQVDVGIIRRLLPYAATMYIAALSTRARAPLEQLAARLEGENGGSGQGLRKLAELVLSASSTPQTKKPAPLPPHPPVSMKDILSALARLDFEEEKLAAAAAAGARRK
jgi:hypothetical protein